MIMAWTDGAIHDLEVARERRRKFFGAYAMHIMHACFTPMSCFYEISMHGKMVLSFTLKLLDEKFIWDICMLHTNELLLWHLIKDKGMEVARDEKHLWDICPACYPST